MTEALELRNGLLGLLTERDLALLTPDLEPVDLPVRVRLAEADARIERVYFLDSGIASVVARLRHAVPIEIGVIGAEGVANLPVVMEAGRSPHSAFMQLAGRGRSIGADSLLAAMARSASLSRILRNYAHVFMVQMASTIQANAQANVSERLARWLAMADDRTHGAGLELTHEFLAMMMGVRRASVSDALGRFDRLGYVRRSRGMVLILDRGGLVEAANGYYGEAEAEYRRLLLDPAD